MRVALISPYSWTVPGGVNDHVENLAARLESKGHEPWIIAPLGTLSRPRPDYPVPERFISAGTAVALRSNGSKAHVNVWPLMMQRMDKLLEHRHFDLLHAHEPCTPSITASAVMVATSPVVGTFHAAGRRSLPYKILSHLAARVVEDLAVKIVVSETAREFISSRFPGEYRIIPNGVNIEAYSAARGRQTIPGRILFIGRAEPRKGLHILLHAFNLVRERIPRASLVVVGSGWSEVRDAASKAWSKMTWPIPGVIALGRVPYQTKIDEMAAAEVLAVPSLEGESFGLVLTEGMAAGLPVVASDLAAYRSVLANGEVGRLFPTADPYALANELVTVLQNNSLQRELIAKGIQAAERFSWERVVDEVILAYEEALVIGAPARDRQPSRGTPRPSDHMHVGARRR